MVVLSQASANTETSLSLKTEKLTTCAYPALTYVSWKSTNNRKYLKGLVGVGRFELPASASRRAATTEPVSIMAQQKKHLKQEYDFLSLEVLDYVVQINSSISYKVRDPRHDLGMVTI